MASANTSNASLLPFTAASFSPPRSAVRINTLWFISLVLSLVSASLGMLIKQWLREYLTGNYTSPRERIRVRHYRHEGLLTWHVFEIAAMPPLLLQLSLILFFVGLSDFLRQLDSIVGWVVTGVVILWLLLLTTSIIAPVLCFRCPYKFPLLKNMAEVPRRAVLRLLRGRPIDEIIPCYYDSSGSIEKGVREDGNLDIHAVIRADEISNDDDFLEATLRPCLKDADGDGVVMFMRKMMEHRLARSVASLASPIIDFRRLTTKALYTSIHIVTDLLENALRRYDQQLTPWLEEALVYLFAAIDHSYADTRAIGYAMGRGLQVQALLMTKGAPFVRICLVLMSTYANVPGYFYQVTSAGE